MRELITNINKNNIPKHIAIIMDGNGRWAKAKGRPRVFGHREGVKSVKAITEIAAEIGVKYLTLYAFSTENWGRPQFEINALMTLLVDSLRQEIDNLHNNNIKLTTIGDITKLPKKSFEALKNGIEKTKNNSKMTLNLALNYSSKWEISKAMREIATLVEQGSIKVTDINECLINKNLTTNQIPDPELLIRTSGENRVSNFLLWQIAYSEFYFTPINWPDFRKQAFLQAIYDFQNRERRFGLTSEQL